MALRIAVYGSLREGMGNHHWHLKGRAKKLSTEVVNIPFNMIDMGGFPGLVMDEVNHNIRIEVYEVSMPVYKGVERLEGYPRFYDRQAIETSAGTADLYFLNQTSEGLESRYSGYATVSTHDGALDWVAHLSNKDRLRNKIEEGEE